MYRERLKKQLDDYVPWSEKDKEDAKTLSDFIDSEEEIFGKENPGRHVTGSAFIVNPEMTKTLLVHHAKLDRWLQPGGHTETDEHVSEGAAREANEETGISDFRTFSDEIFDVDIHYIPGRGEAEGHYHYDVRYLIIADEKEEIVVSHESNDVKWFSFEEAIRITNEESILRMIERIRSGKI